MECLLKKERLCNLKQNKTKPEACEIPTIWMESFFFLDELVVGEELF